MSTKKTKLVTLLMFLTLCGFVVQATADEESLKYDLYGQAHLALESHDNGDSSAFHVASNSSRLGVRGQEELDYGLFAVYQLEAAIQIDEGDWGTTLRNTYAGLSHETYGRFIAGRHDTPFKCLATGNDLFVNRVGDNRNILGVANNSGGGTHFNQRLDDIVVYQSPTLYGFSCMLGYSADGDDADPNEDKYAVSGSLNYRAADLFTEGDSLKCGVGYETRGKGYDDNGVNEDKGVRLAGTYKTGPFTFAGIYEMLMDLNGVQDVDRDAFGVGAAYDVGMCVLKAAFYTTDGIDGQANSGADMVVFGADKKLSKHTTLYAAFATMSNDSGSALRVSGGGHGTVVAAAGNGEDPSVLSLGIIHKFP